MSNNISLTALAPSTATGNFLGRLRSKFSGFLPINLAPIGHIVQRTAQGVIGLGICAYAAAFQSNALTPAVHLAAQLVLPSCYIARQGFKDIAAKRYLKGAIEIASGVSGLAASSYMLFNELLAKKTPKPEVHSPALPEPIEQFLGAHTSEISSLYPSVNCYNYSSTSPKNWSLLGYGGAKTTYIHSELPGYVVKFPLCNFGAKEIYNHFENMKVARKIAFYYPRVFLPDTYLVETSQGPILIESKLDLVGYDDFKGDRAMARWDLSSFLREGRFYDIQVDLNHNAGFLKGTESNPRIGVYDLDNRK